jgi:preprotein translocase subunit SecE
LAFKESGKQGVLMADKIKLVLAVLLVIAGLAGFYLLKDSALILRIASVLAGLVLAAVVVWTTAPGKQFFAFSQEAIVETKKVVWPTRKETVQTTGLVLAFVLVMAIFLWIVDALLVWGVKLLMGPGA